MSLAGLKLYRAQGGWHHFCPGCQSIHRLPDGWRFDGNLESPTFTPSFKHSWGNKMICHYFLTAGQLVFCSDSTHRLAGQSVALPEFPG
ncbi:MAG: DUF6527 family protein [Alphaproteobacteria bacterium]